MDGQVSKAVVQERYDRLIELQDRISWDENKNLVGTEVEVLVSTFTGKKDGATGRVSGRARDGRLVHVAVGDSPAEPGDILTATVSYAAPHHLVADGGITSRRPRRGGPARPSTGHGASPLLSIGRRPV
jgi:tRNA-2-methylthio-N6-dimethylallyladenosine synthase